MLSVHVQLELKASPEEVWKLISGFNDVPAFLPVVEKSSLDETGRVRHLTLAGGGGVVVEQLEEHNDEQRFYRYSIIDSPLPLSNYVATIRVHGEDGSAQSIVDWSSHFNANGVPDEEAVAIVQGVYQAGFDHLQKIFAGT